MRQTVEKHCKDCKYFTKSNLPCGWHLFTPKDMNNGGCADFSKKEKETEETNE
jgi:hypothetical protein